MYKHTISKTRRGNLFRIVYMGACFMLILTAFNSAQNMMAHIYENLGYQNLTQICLSVEYFFLILTSFPSSYYVGKLSNKAWLILGAITNGAFISAGALVTYCHKYDNELLICDTTFIYVYNIAAAALLGLLGTIFWTCQGIYVNKCADEKTRGMYNGIFLSLMQSSQLWSGVISTAILGNTDEYTFYLVLLGIISAAIIMISLSTKPLEYDSFSENQEIPVEGLWALMKTFVSEILVNKKYVFLFCGMAFSGLTTGFFPNYLGTTVSYTIPDLSGPIVEERIGFVFLILAMGEILAGLIVGKLSTKFHKAYVLSFAFIVGEIAIIVTFLSDYFQNYTIAMFSGGLWGFCDNATQTMVMVIIGSQFGSRPELYASFNMFQAIGSLSVSSLTILMSSVSPLCLIAIVGTLIVCVHGVLMIHMPRKTKVYEESVLSESLNA